MSDTLNQTKFTKRNKGIAREARARRRAQAEARNAEYQKLTIAERMDRNSVKVQKKLRRAHLVSTTVEVKES